jgi:predicted phosphoribosyltransferase
VFKNRKEGGIQLGKALLKYRKESPLVIGIPRGGLETAYEVAKLLGTRAIPVVSRKLGFPKNPEFAMGAISEGGSLYLSPLAKAEVSKEDLEYTLAKERQELQRRISLLRGSASLPSFKGKTVLVVDDGIATGATLLATLQFCKKQGSKKLVVAAPIGAPDTLKKIRELVDDLVVLESPEDFYSVSQGYDFFPSLSDEETQLFLEAPFQPKSLPSPDDSLPFSLKKRSPKTGNFSS